MALRNVLLLCGAIVGAGAVAGLSMQSRSYFAQNYTAPSDTFAPDDQRATPGSGTAPSYGPPQGASGPPADQQQVPSQAPSGDETRGNQPQLVALTQVDNADRILPRMPVEDSNGKPLGEVAQVLMHNGRPQEVLLDEGTRIPAGDLMYSPSRSVLIAQTSPGGTGG